MHVTIIQGAFLPIPPLQGGAVEKMWFSLAGEFVSLGHQVDYISREYDALPKNQLCNGVNHIRVKGYEPPRNGVWLKFLDFLYSYRAVAKVQAKTSVVVTNSFWTPILLNSQLKPKVFVDVQRMPKGQMKFYSKSACLRANSTPVADAIRAELPSHLRKMVTMIPNPLPFKITKPLPQKKENIILYCGRIHKEKGIDILLKAASKLKPGWRVRIVGPWETKQGGSGRDYLEHLKSLVGEADVTFVDPIFDTDELNFEYQNASIFVYPSVAEKGETFGLAPLEAMAWGCVPIVSNLDCFKDFINDGINGLIFDHRIPDPASDLWAKLDSLIDDPARRSEIAVESEKVLNSHSCTQIALQFINEFERISNG